MFFISRLEIAAAQLFRIIFRIPCVIKGKRNKEIGGTKINENRTEFRIQSSSFNFAFRKEHEILLGT